MAHAGRQAKKQGVSLGNRVRILLQMCSRISGVAWKQTWTTWIGTSAHSLRFFGRFLVRDGCRGRIPLTSVSAAFGIPTNGVDGFSEEVASYPTHRDPSMQKWPVVDGDWTIPHQIEG